MSAMQLAVQAQVSIISVWKVANHLCLLPFKLGRFKQIKEAVTGGECIFAAGFCLPYMAVP
jgi:hypothetical protein